jgi:hypothetical protein
MARKTFLETLRSWRLMIENLRPLLAEQPHFAPVHAELEARLARAEEIERRLHALRGEQRRLMEERNQTVKEGALIRSRLAGGLRWVFGGQNDALHVYGVHPRPKTLKRRRKETARPGRKRKPGEVKSPAAEPAS